MLVFAGQNGDNRMPPAARESFWGPYLRIPKAYVLVIRVFGLILLASAWHTGFFISTTAAQETLQEDLEFYQAEVLPILSEHCYECHSHSAKKSSGGLMVDSAASLLVGGDSGPAIEPGQPEASLLVDAILYESLEMPPAGKISSDEVKILIEWIERGAPGPALALPPDSSSTADNHEGSSAEGSPREHWAFLPLTPPELPSSVEAGPDAIDHLIELKRRGAGVKAVPAASLQTVVQRLYSDLHGLPVEPAELERLGAMETGALERVVDDLLSDSVWH